jgi:hypothetical protein
MGAPCKVTFEGKTFFKPDFIKRFLDTLHLDDDVVDNSPYLKSIKYDNSFNEGDPMLIREKKAEAKAEAEEKKASIFDDFDSTNKGKSIKSKAEANKAFKEKYGEDAAVAKAISSNFEAIADELKAKGIFTKIKC